MGIIGTLFYIHFNFKIYFIDYWILFHVKKWFLIFFGVFIAFFCLVVCACVWRQKPFFCTSVACVRSTKKCFFFFFSFVGFVREGEKREKALFIYFFCFFVCFVAQKDSQKRRSGATKRGETCCLVWRVVWQRWHNKAKRNVFVLARKVEQAVRVKEESEQLSGWQENW